MCPPKRQVHCFVLNFFSDKEQAPFSEAEFFELVCQNMLTNTSKVYNNHVPYTQTRCRIVIQRQHR